MYTGPYPALRAQGKFLLSGEYAVLDGAAAFALPLRFGQSLSLRNHEGELLIWTSLEADGTPWFKGSFHPGTGMAVESTDAETARQLERLLQACPKNARIKHLKGQHLRIQADFNRDWGLGSSSTLVWLLARLLQLNPYPLLDASFGGSGYDLACAAAGGPLLYQRKEGKVLAQPVAMPQPILERLFFIYSGKKQSSQEAMEAYRKLPKEHTFTERMDALSRKLAQTRHPEQFGTLLEAVEALVREYLPTEGLRHLFPDYPGLVKPMGAWGGDFFLAYGPPELTQGYFEQKGLAPIWQAQEVVLNHEQNNA